MESNQDTPLTAHERMRLASIEKVIDAASSSLLDMYEVGQAPRWILDAAHIQLCAQKAEVSVARDGWLERPTDGRLILAHPWPIGPY